MKRLIEGLRKFQTGYFKIYRELFEELAYEQNPRILFITCSDSRIDPNLITQVKVGELFVIRNAGNIIPPYGAANGGEGAALEYALEALNIEEIIVCGHSNCGAIKGLLKISELEEKMPLVYQWLKHAEPTRRLVKENYQDLVGDELLDTATAENVLAQLNNLQTYPSVRSRLHQGRLCLHGWLYELETAAILAYDPVSHQFVPVQNGVNVFEPKYSLHPGCLLEQDNNSNVFNGNSQKNSNGYGHLPLEQAERIYRGTR